MKRGTVALFPQVLKETGPIDASGTPLHTVGPTGRSFRLEPSYTLGSNCSGRQVFQVSLQIISPMSYYKTP